MPTFSFKTCSSGTTESTGVIFILLTPSRSSASGYEGRPELAGDPDNGFLFLTVTGQKI